MAGDSWEFYKEGKYNKTYVNGSHTHILKIPKLKHSYALFLQTDTPERSVRLWNLINPDLQPKAEIIHTSYGKGWICPFVEGVQASTKEIHHGLIDIFNRTGRIVVDAISPNNFLKTPKGEIICIDIGMALQLESLTERYSVSKVSSKLRRNKSLISLDSWAVMYGEYMDYFDKWLPHYPLAVNTVKALLFIQKYYPDITDVNFLRDNARLVQTLSEAYSEAEKNSQRKAPMGDVSKADVSSGEGEDLKEGGLPLSDELSLEEVKTHCDEVLKAYIESRGDIKDKQFTPLWGTSFFRDADLTQRKVLKAQNLREDIAKAKSISEIQFLIQVAQSHRSLMVGRFETGLKSCLADCLNYIAPQMRRALAA